MITIEAVKPTDATELLTIYAPYVLETAISFEYEVPSEEEFRQRIENISQKYPYLKAVDENGVIVGYAYGGCFKNRRAYDWAAETTIYIRREYRRKGIGKLLYARLEKELKAMGILSINACIAVPQIENSHLTLDSPRFHQKMGYSLVGTFHSCGYKFDSWYDMVWMEKMIGEHKAAPIPVRFKQSL